ncbi:aminotransferase class V-fold PLP-dependent enzyme [Chloroflexi bacterium TSY]|nr:aminotransferase class V-fold PLP-dependent enzyme [Chloroflexi bacterium TSY]
MQDKQQPSLTGLSRGRALIHTAHLIERAWHSFDRARPAQPQVDDSIRELLSMPLPDEGIDAIDALDEADKILDQSLSQSRPHYFAFIGSSGLEMGVMADALAASHDVNLAVYAGAANLVEQQALRWVGELIGYPGRHGSFTSGGMLSNLTALTAAREQVLPNSRIDGVRSDVAVYVSRDAHSSVARAVEILGFGSRSLRDIPLDGLRRMDAAALRKTVEQDRASNVTPLAIVASAGTTLAGAVDPIAEIATLAEEQSIWLHVDGAYGLSAAAIPDVRHHFVGLERADSMSIDAHKWLFLPKPCGLLLVRDQHALTAAFT